MRQRVLEAAVECLLETVSHEVSFAVIANRAGISRGGVQYHFATRYELLCAVFEFISARRLRQFAQDLSDIPRGHDVAEHIVITHWNHLNEPDFRVYQELVLLARGDPQLTAEFGRLYQAFLHDWYETAREAFGWQYTDPSVARAGNIVHYVLEGMAYGQLAGQLSPEAVTDLLEYSKAVLREAITGLPKPG